MPGKKVRAPPLLPTERPQILQRINPRRQHRPRRRLLVALEEPAGWHARVFRGQRADPRRGELAAGRVDRIARLRGDDGRVDAEVLAGGEAEGEEGRRRRGREVEKEVGVEQLELGQRLLHLVHGAGAVEELGRGGGPGQGVGDDEGEEGNGLAGARRHLEHAVPAGVERPLELQHVGVLLRVDVGVGEVHRYLLKLEFHLLRPGASVGSMAAVLVTAVAAGGGAVGIRAMRNLK